MVGCSFKLGCEEGSQILIDIPPRLVLKSIHSISDMRIRSKNHNPSLCSYSSPLETVLLVDLGAFVQEYFSFSDWVLGQLLGHPFGGCGEEVKLEEVLVGVSILQVRSVGVLCAPLGNKVGCNVGECSGS